MDSTDDRSGMRGKPCSARISPTRRARMRTKRSSRASLSYAIGRSMRRFYRGPGGASNAGCRPLPRARCADPRPRHLPRLPGPARHPGRRVQSPRQETPPRVLTCPPAARYLTAMRADTVPGLFCREAPRRAGRVAMRRKRLGVWEETTWQAYAEEVRAVALGLAAVGVERGQRVAIASENRPEWLGFDFARQSAGGRRRAGSHTK